MKLLIFVAIMLANMQALATCFYSGAFVCQASEEKYGATYATELVQFTFLYKSDSTCVANNDMDTVRNNIVEEYKDQGTFAQECNPDYDAEHYLKQVNLQKFSLPMPGFSSNEKLHEVLKTSVNSDHERCKFNMERNPRLYNCLLEIEDLNLN